MLSFAVAMLRGEKFLLIFCALSLSCLNGTRQLWILITLKYKEGFVIEKSLDALLLRYLLEKKHKILTKNGNNIINSQV